MWVRFPSPAPNFVPLCGTKFDPETATNRSSFRTFLGVVCAIFILAGCATAPHAGPLTPAYTPPKIERQKAPGVYHRVEKGQTLWRIAKYYNVDIEKIVKANRIPDIAQVSAGQLIFIPEAQKREVPVSAAPDFIWPVRGKVASFYGSKKDGVLNKGIDICARSGADVVASKAGKVVFADTKLKGYGQTIIIDHLDGFSTLYAQNSAILVKPQSMVRQGEPIARVGSSGRAKEPCLHYEIRKGDKPQNPFYYLPR